MPGGRRSAEVKIYGRNACRAVFERRADDVLRVYLTEELLAPLGDILRELATRRRPYRVVPEADLEALTESTHHEGICVVARPKSPVTLDQVLAPAGPGFVVVLPDVGNPHNLGAIVRIAAHFGARAVLLAGASARLSSAAYRTAQGGAEWVEVVGVAELGRALATMRRAGFKVCATASQRGRDLFARPLPARAVVVLGAEGTGLPATLLDDADEVLRIPGTGHVESLNVASAASVIAAELWRTHAKPRPARMAKPVP